MEEEINVFANPEAFQYIAQQVTSKKMTDAEKIAMYRKRWEEARKYPIYSGGELIGDALTYANNPIGVVGGLGLSTASRRADPRNSTGDIVWGDVVDGASFVNIPRKTKVLNLEKDGWGMYKREFKKNKVIGLLDLINDGQDFANDLSNAAQVYEEEQHNLKEADRIAHELEQKRRREIIKKSIENAKYKKFIGR